MDHINLKDLTTLMEFMHGKLECQNGRKIAFFFKASLYEKPADDQEQQEMQSLGTLLTRMQAIKSDLPQEDIEQILQAEEESAVLEHDNGSYKQLMDVVSKVKDTIGIDFFFKNAWCNNFYTHLDEINNLQNLQELMLFQLVNFESILKDFDWISLPNLRVLSLSIFYQTTEQFLGFFKRFPGSCPNLETLTLYILDLNISR